MRYYFRKFAWEFARFGLTPEKAMRRLWHRSDLPAGFIVNSVPKAGTHLLERVLSLHPDCSRRMKRKLYAGNIDEHGGWGRHIGSLRRGEYLLVHMPDEQALQGLLAEHGIKQVLVVRDPRALLASLARYLKTNPRHEHHSRTKDLSFAETVEFCMKVPFAPLNVTYMGYSYLFYEWIGHPTTLIVRYEDLVSGTFEDRAKQIDRILEHVGLDRSPEIVKFIVDRCIDNVSKTFRRAEPEGWRRDLAPVHIEQVEQAARRFEEFGYEFGTEKNVKTIETRA